MVILVNLNLYGFWFIFVTVMVVKISNLEL